MRRALLLTLSVVLLLGFYAGSVPTASANDWCFDDPIVMIDGQIVQILNGVSGKPDEVRRKVQVAYVTIFVPAGVDTRVLKTTSVYFREEVRFVSVGGQTSSGGWDDRGNGGNNGNGNSNNSSNNNSNNNGNGNNNNSGSNNGGRGNSSGNGNNNDRGKRPISVTVVVTFEATASLPAMTRVIYPGGLGQDHGTTRSRLSETFVLR